MVSQLVLVLLCIFAAKILLVDVCGLGCLYPTTDETVSPCAINEKACLHGGKMNSVLLLRGSFWALWMCGEEFLHVLLFSVSGPLYQVPIPSLVAYAVITIEVRWPDIVCLYNLLSAHIEKCSQQQTLALALTVLSNTVGSVYLQALFTFYIVGPGRLPANIIILQKVLTSKRFSRSRIRCARLRALGPVLTEYYNRKCLLESTFFAARKILAKEISRSLQSITVAVKVSQ